MSTKINEVLQVQLRTVYGNNWVYPISENALVLTELIGKRTFTLRHLETLESLGFRIEWVPQTLNIPGQTSVSAHTQQTH